MNYAVQRSARTPSQAGPSPCCCGSYCESPGPGVEQFQSPLWSPLCSQRVQSQLPMHCTVTVLHHTKI